MTRVLLNKRLDDVQLEGKRFKSQVEQRVLSADVSLTMEGATTFTLGIHDPDRKLIRSKLFDSRITSQIDKWAFELVQVRKYGDVLTVVMESLAVAKLRDQREPRKVAAGVMTREQFAKELVDEVKWIGFRGPKKPVEKTKVPLARGKIKKLDESGPKNENTWDCLDRLAQEVNWCRFELTNQIWFLPEKELLEADPGYVLRSDKPEVVDLSWDHDIGKPVATVNASVQRDKWQVPPGGVVKVEEEGPANGKYLVASVDGSLFSDLHTITLRKPEPTLPEPKPPKGAGDKYHDGEGSGTGSGGGKGRGDWVWPISGRVSQEFGDGHDGIDIAAPIGTPIYAARDGVVTYAGEASGYGKAVYIDHGEGVICRYGHMSVIACARGQKVDGGEKIAECGAEGNSTGPHLHFEYRPGDVPKNPRAILGGG